MIQEETEATGTRTPKHGMGPRSPAADNQESLPWEIIHVPGKPPSLEHSTVDVIASTIEPRLANNLVRQLNQICPLEDLRHVKRVRRKIIEGKVELSVILCLSQDHVNHADDMPSGILQLLSVYQLIPFNAKVAKYAAASKEEWEEQCKLWPTSYHPSNNNLDGVGGFTEEESQPIFSYIKDAIRLTRLGHLGDKQAERIGGHERSEVNQVVNAAVIVDPSSRQIIARGSDQTCSDPASDKQKALVASMQSDANGLRNNGADSIPMSSGLENGDKKLSPDSSPDGCSQSYTSVACLYPWSWTSHRPCNSWHPLRHAALVAIENAAARDKQLFPGSGSLEEQPGQEESLQHSSSSIPAKRQKIQTSDNEDSLDGVLPSESMRPYLCTGFDIFLVWEPCTMCAMALVHQRIRRIFYAFPNPNSGALGSVYRLQGEKSLNHHYSVFRIILPEKFLHNVESNYSYDDL